MPTDRKAHNKLLNTLGMPPNSYPSIDELRRHRINTLDSGKVDKADRAEWRSAYRTLFAESKTAAATSNAAIRQLAPTPQELNNTASKLRDEDFDNAAKHMPKLGSKKSSSSKPHSTTQRTSTPASSPIPQKPDPMEQELQDQIERMERQNDNYRSILDQQGDSLQDLRSSEQQQQQLISQQRAELRAQKQPLHRLKKQDKQLKKQESDQDKSARKLIGKNEALVKGNKKLAGQNHKLRQQLDPSTPDAPKPKTKKSKDAPVKKLKTTSPRPAPKSQYSTNLSAQASRKISVPKRIKRTSLKDEQPSTQRALQLQKKLAKLRRTNSRLQNKAAKQQRKIKSLKGSIERGDRKIRQQENKINNQSRTINTLSARMPRRRESLRSRERTTARLSEQHDKLSTMSETLQKQNNQLQQQVDAIQAPQQTVDSSASSAKSPAVGMSHAKQQQPTFCKQSPASAQHLSASQAFKQAKKEDPDYYKSGKNQPKSTRVIVGGKSVEAKVYSFKDKAAMDRFKQRIGGRELKQSASKDDPSRSRSTSTDSRQDKLTRQHSSAESSAPRAESRSGPG